MTDFVHWYALREADDHAPSGPGVFQVKISRGLLTYPGGKSAMVHYASSPDLRQAIARLAGDHDDLDFLCRHQSSEQPAVLLQFVQTQFERRFGRSPNWPTTTETLALRSV